MTHSVKFIHTIDNKHRYEYRHMGTGTDIVILIHTNEKARNLG